MEILVSILNCYWEKENDRIFEISKKELTKTELQIKEKVIKEITKELQKLPIDKNTLSKKNNVARLYSNGLLQCKPENYYHWDQELAIVTDATYEIPEDFLNKLNEEEKIIKELEETEKMKKIIKSLKPKKEKTTYKKKELLWLTNVITAEIFLMENTSYLSGKVKEAIKWSLNSENTLIIKLLMKTDEKNESYLEMIKLLIKNEETSNSDIYTNKDKICLQDLKELKKNEKLLIQLLRENTSHNWLEIRVEENIKKIFNRAIKQEVIEKNTYFSSKSLLELQYYYPTLTFLEKKLGFETKTELKKFNKIMREVAAGVSEEKRKKMGIDDKIIEQKTKYLESLPDD